MHKQYYEVHASTAKTEELKDIKRPLRSGYSAGSASQYPQ